MGAREMFDKLRGEPHYFDFLREIIRVFTIFQKRSCQNIKVVLYLKLPNKTLQFNIGDFLLSYGYTVLFCVYFFIPDRTYFAGVEFGKRNISIVKLEKISYGLDVSLGKLVDGIQ